MCRSCFQRLGKESSKTGTGLLTAATSLDWSWGRLEGAGKNSSTSGVFMVAPDRPRCSRRRSAPLFWRPGEPEMLFDQGAVGGFWSEREEFAVVHGGGERLAVPAERARRVEGGAGAF